MVPDSLHGLKRGDIVYRDIEDPHAVTPVIFSVRLMERSGELRHMLATIDDIDDATGVAHIKEAL